MVKVIFEEEITKVFGLHRTTKKDIFIFLQEQFFRKET